MYMSPLLFCGGKKQKTNKQTKEKEKRSTLARLRVNDGQKTSQLGCFSKITHLANDVALRANQPVQGFLARKNTPLEGGPGCKSPHTGCAFSSKHPQECRICQKHPPIGCVTEQKYPRSGVSPSKNTLLEVKEGNFKVKASSFR